MLLIVDVHKRKRQDHKSVSVTGIATVIIMMWIVIYNFICKYKKSRSVIHLLPISYFQPNTPLVKQKRIFQLPQLGKIIEIKWISFLMTWQGNYEKREGRSFIVIELCIHCFQDYETCIGGYIVLFHAIWAQSHAS